MLSITNIMKVFREYLVVKPRIINRYTELLHFVHWTAMAVDLHASAGVHISITATAATEEGPAFLMMRLAATVMMVMAPAEAKEPFEALSKGQWTAGVVTAVAVAATSAMTVTMAMAVATMRASCCIIWLLKALMPTSV